MKENEDNNSSEYGHSRIPQSNNDNMKRQPFGSLRHTRVPDIVVGPGNLLIPPAEISPRILSNILNATGWTTRVNDTDAIVQVATAGVPLSIVQDESCIRFMSEWLFRPETSTEEKLGLANEFGFRAGGLTFTWLPPVMATLSLEERSRPVPDVVSVSFSLNYQSGVTTNQITAAASYFLEQNSLAMQTAKERGLLDERHTPLFEE